MTTTLRELKRVANDPRLGEMIRTDGHLPTSPDDEQRDRLAQLAQDVRVIQRVTKEIQDWAGRQAAVESEKLRDRSELARLEHEQRLELVSELFEHVGLEQPSADLKEIENAYPAVSDLVYRHVRDLETMGPGREARLAAEVSGRGGVLIEDEVDVVVEAGRAIRDSLPALGDWQAEVDRLAERAEAGVDPADWDETWCATIDQLQRSVSYPMVPSPDDPDPRPELAKDVERRLTDWGLLGRGDRFDAR